MFEKWELKCEMKLNFKECVYQTRLKSTLVPSPYVFASHNLMTVAEENNTNATEALCAVCSTGRLNACTF